MLQFGTETMPIYEYRCNNCQRKISVFVQGIPESLAPICTWCGSNSLTRLFSSFVMGKSEGYKRKGVYDDILSDPRLIRGMEQNDPRALTEWNRKMTSAMEEEPSPEFDELIGRMEAGEPLEEVMKRVQGQGEEESKE